MESVVIVAPTPTYMEKLRARIPTELPVSETGRGGLVIERGASRVYLEADPYVRSELEPGELEKVLRIIPTPAFFCLDFSDISLCKLLLSAIADDETILVDNDHGTMLRGSDFVERLRKMPLWDWRGEE